MRRLFYYARVTIASNGGADTAVLRGWALLYYVNTKIPQGQGPIIIRDHAPGTATLAVAAHIPNGAERIACRNGHHRSNVRRGYGRRTHMTSTLNLHATDHRVRRAAWHRHRRSGPWTSPDIWAINQSGGYGRRERTHPPSRQTAIAACRCAKRNRDFMRACNQHSARETRFDVEVAFFISEAINHTVGRRGGFHSAQVRCDSITCRPRHDGVCDVDTHESRIHTPCVTGSCLRAPASMTTNSANNSAQQNLQRPPGARRHSPRFRTPVTTTVQITYSRSPSTAKLMYFRRRRCATRVEAGNSWPDRAYPRGGSEDSSQTWTLTPPPDAPNCTSPRHSCHCVGLRRRITLVRVVGPNSERESGEAMQVLDMNRCDVAQGRSTANCKVERDGNRYFRRAWKHRRQGGCRHLGSAGIRPELRRTPPPPLARRDSRGSKPAGAF
jgi:hypothetical protein